MIRHGQRLPFGELETSTGAALAVLLPFLHALTQLAVVVEKCSGDSVTDCSSLTARSATFHAHQDVEMLHSLGQGEGLLDDHLEHFVGEIFIDLPVIDRDLSRALPQMYAR